MNRGFLMSLIAGWVGIHATEQVTSRVSVSSAGRQGNGDSGADIGPVMSQDGRYVAFASSADNLVPGDTNGTYDIFVRDLLTGTTERASVDAAGTEGHGLSVNPTISADGRYVAFASFADNLVPGDTNGTCDVFVRDRQNGTTERVSVSSSGTQGDDDSGAYGVSLSADGRYVAFFSLATNLVPGDTNNWEDIFVRDRQTGITERVDVDSAGVQANYGAGYPAISSDGRFVAFTSDSTNLVPGDTNGALDVFVHDRQSGTTERVSVSTSGNQGNHASSQAAISSDGRFVAFTSAATNLVAGDTNGSFDVFVRDRQNGTTERVSVDSAGTQGNASSGYYFLYTGLAISSDGNCVAFSSDATNLVTGDTNGFPDVFVRNRFHGTTERVSVSTSGRQGNGVSLYPSISGDGRFVAFSSYASSLVSGDTNAMPDGFVHDRGYTPATSLCDPGAAGVQACPCSNPPSGPGRGCDNSSGTGGALLLASGVAYLSADSLVFTTADEKPTATSILLQGSAVAGSGIVYGQGVRCVAGVLKRLFTKPAVAGSITAPDFVAGDPTVSARSAANGDVISSGQSRWYLVYYRDPNVLGGCPASSTFNATRTEQVTWWP